MSVNNLSIISAGKVSLVAQLRTESIERAHVMSILDNIISAENAHIGYDETFTIIQNFARNLKQRIGNGAIDRLTALKVIQICNIFETTNAHADTGSAIDNLHIILTLDNPANEPEQTSMVILTQATKDSRPKRPLIQRQIIQSRGEVNRLSIAIRIFERMDNRQLTAPQAELELIRNYGEAFRAEFLSETGKTGIQYIRDHERQWKSIFRRNLAGRIAPDKAEKLFLLSWIESNGNPALVSDAGAIGPFQILLSTAQKYRPGVTQQQLQDPIISAEIASKYLADLIDQEKAVNPQLTDDEYIKAAIRRYNGNWVDRLKPDMRANAFNTFYRIVRDLRYIKNQLSRGRRPDGRLYTSVEARAELQSLVHNIYFTPTRDGRSHFRILNERYNTPAEDKAAILVWIDRYSETIIKQQLMYPYQYFGVIQAYERPI